MESNTRDKSLAALVNASDEKLRFISSKKYYLQFSYLIFSKYFASYRRALRHLGLHHLDPTLSQSLENLGAPKTCPVMS